MAKKAIIALTESQWTHLNDVKSKTLKSYTVQIRDLLQKEIDSIKQAKEAG